MPSIFTLEGSPTKRKRSRKRKSSGLGAPAIGTCKCVRAGRSGSKRRKICFVGKSKKAPTGWLFQKGGDCR